MADTTSITTAQEGTAPNRSVSRGREFFSSGRGGLGNIRREDLNRSPSSPSSPVRTNSNADELSRGREPPAVAHDTAKSTGRGGAGNIRSNSTARAAHHPPSDGQPSLTTALTSDQVDAGAEYERRIFAARQDPANTRRTYGRGGAGNAAVSPSKSRSRSRSASVGPLHSSGRGGAGNLHPGAAALDADDRHARAISPEGRHSTGRGGLANITALPSPPPDGSPAAAHPAEYTGRGGAGNILRGASKDPPPAADGGLKRLWERVSRSRSRAPAPASPIRERGGDGEVDVGAVDQRVWEARGRATRAEAGYEGAGAALSVVSSRSGDERTLAGSVEEQGGGSADGRTVQ
ncbi:hypothetical protein FOMPIDRAFT_1054280 [Fomitopsis schrenkii]|uniref:Uncharacterized protein n=1 Tax=Fomitopsis schrenkii TaxID=2126942 RepID=S8F9G9_FOMSC|nr:hypothetical protein FOMPIDRAFT_1054280 [Fomitopsis schrenkii]